MIGGYLMREVFEVIGFGVTILAALWACLTVGDRLGCALDAKRHQEPR